MGNVQLPEGRGRRGPPRGERRRRKRWKRRKRMKRRKRRKKVNLLRRGEGDKDGYHHELFHQAYKEWEGREEA